MDRGQVLVVQLGIAGQRVAVGGDKNVVYVLFRGFAGAQVGFLVRQGKVLYVPGKDDNRVSHGIVGEYALIVVQGVQVIGYFAVLGLGIIRCGGKQRIHKFTLFADE